MSRMRFSALALAVLALAGCGAEADQRESTGPAASPPYSDSRTGPCLERAGYEISYSHGDPESGKPEDVVFDVWLEELGSTTVYFYHPSTEPPPDGEVFGNAVVVLDPEVATDEDRARILECLS